MFSRRKYFPIKPPVSGKRRRYAAYAGRARRDLEAYLAERPDVQAGVLS